MRTRLIRPDFFDDYQVAQLPFGARLLLIGLWCCADREGRLWDLPKQIEGKVFPYEHLDGGVGPWLDSLAKVGLIDRYELDDGRRAIQIIGFKQSQRCHPNERQSTIPPRSTSTSASTSTSTSTSTDGHQRCAKGDQEVHHQGMTSAHQGLTKGDPVDVEQLVKRMLARHPRKVGMVSALRALREVLAEPTDPEATAERIEEVHRAWCESLEWKQDGGRFAPRLDRWIREGGYMDPPPEVEEPLPEAYVPYWELPQNGAG